MNRSPTLVASVRGGVGHANPLAGRKLVGSRLDIFSLYKLPTDGHVLLRVERRDSSNVDEADIQASIDEAYQFRERLLTHAFVALGLPANSTGELIGEFQDFPVGDLLCDASDGSEIDVWVAPTRFGHPWVVLGTAADEESFWKEIADEPDLSSLDTHPPARLLRVCFFSDRVFKH